MVSERSFPPSRFKDIVQADDMGLKSVRAPAPFVPLFEAAEGQIGGMFDRFDHQPQKGSIHVGGERYLLVRANGFYLAWFDAMAETFGEDMARQFVYNTAREIGRNDSREISAKLELAEPPVKLAAGPVHFAHAGWAIVDIMDDSAPAPDESYYLHYRHPNTFESEVCLRQGRETDKCMCLFSAGYSAGWCSEAFGLEVHAREFTCSARKDEHCEFVMGPADKLDALVARGRGD